MKKTFALTPFYSALHAIVLWANARLEYQECTSFQVSAVDTFKDLVVFASGCKKANLTACINRLSPNSLAG